MPDTKQSPDEMAGELKRLADEHAANVLKSNNWWPDMPVVQGELL